MTDTPGESLLPRRSIIAVPVPATAHPCTKHHVSCTMVGLGLPNPDRASGLFGETRLARPPARLVSCALAASIRVARHPPPIPRSIPCSQDVVQLGMVGILWPESPERGELRPILILGGARSLWAVAWSQIWSTAAHV